MLRNKDASGESGGGGGYDKMDGGRERVVGQSEGPERSQRMGGVAVHFLEKGVYSIGVCVGEKGEARPTQRTDCQEHANNTIQTKPRTGCQFSAHCGFSL